MTSWWALQFKAHHEAGRLLVVEGDPGAGKTSSIMSGNWGADVLVMPQLERVSATSDPRAPEAEYPEDWYIEAEHARQENVLNALRAGRVVIQDRSVLSTAAFVYASTVERGSQRRRVRRFLRRLAQGPDFIQPDALIVMQVEIDIGRARRPTFRYSDRYRVWFESGFLTRFQLFYRHLVPQIVTCPTTVVDTSSLSKNDVWNVLARAYETLGHADRLP